MYGCAHSAQLRPKVPIGCTSQLSLPGKLGFQQWVLGKTLPQNWLCGRTSPQHLVYVRTLPQHWVDVQEDTPPTLSKTATVAFTNLM